MSFFVPDGTVGRFTRSFVVREGEGEVALVARGDVGLVVGAGVIWDVTGAVTRIVVDVVPRLTGDKLNLVVGAAAIRVVTTSVTGVLVTGGVTRFTSDVGRAVVA